MLQTILRTLVLPNEITTFEREHVKKVNTVAFYFYLAHIPIFATIAFFNDTGPMTALVLTSALCIGPAVAWKAIENPRHVAVVMGITSMLMGGLLVHFGQGPLQIEMHFYFFVLLALLAVYAVPMVIVAAAITVAIHHLALWWLLPKSVFNYDAPVWVVLLHECWGTLHWLHDAGLPRQLLAVLPASAWNDSILCCLTNILPGHWPFAKILPIPPKPDPSLE